MTKPLMPILNEPQPKTLDITKVLEYGNGYLIIECVDGNKYKRHGGSLSWRNNNPGNLKYGDFSKKYGAVGAGYSGHAVFPNPKTGAKAQIALLFTEERGYNKLTILEAIRRYAPASDGNSPTKYAKYISGKLKVSLSTKLQDLSESKRSEMISAMQYYEGFDRGTISKL
jgi:hypothetical protein